MVVGVLVGCLIGNYVKRLGLLANDFCQRNECNECQSNLWTSPTMMNRTNTNLSCCLFHTLSNHNEANF